MIALANAAVALRHALRSLRRSPAFTLTVVATLGIGIGLNAAIFTVVDCVLLRPLGYRDADRIVAVRTHLLDQGRSINKMGGEDFIDLSREVKGLEAAATYKSWSDGLDMDGSALYLPVARVSAGFGVVMGVEPIAGRLFRSDDTTGTEALVGAAFAREHFGSSQAALGRSVRSDGVPRPIVGVLPDGFSFPGSTAVWIETTMSPAWAGRTAYNQSVVAKRRAGVSEAQLNAELDTFSRQLQRAFPEDRQKTIEAVSLQEQIVGKIRPTIRLLMGSVAVILLIVCANVTHLQLVRATLQLRSVTIRTALGAARGTLAARALIEAALLALAGCALAVLLAVPALELVLRIAPPEIPRLSDVHLNQDVLLFSSLASLVLMALTAVLPVWRSWHVNPAFALRQDPSRGSEGRNALRLRNGFIVAEVALTLTLSVSAILLTRQLIAQSRADLGFSAASLLTLDSHTIETAPPPPDLPKDSSPAQQAVAKAAEDSAGKHRLVHLDAILASVAEVPGVDAIAATSGAPMGFGGADVGYAIKGRQVFAPGVVKLPDAEIRAVTPGLFSTMGIPLLSGRGLTAEDRIDTPKVLLINQVLAQTMFPGQDPIGQQIQCGYDDPGTTWWTIVGVVGNIRDSSPAAAPSPTFYVPLAQHTGVADDVQILARTRTDPAAMVETLQRRLKQTHPEVAIKGTTMRANIGETQRTEQFRTLLFGSFAGISILLAAVGMYGVTAYTVSQRRFEFGLRMALGSNRSQLLGLVLRKALGTALIGISIGAAMSLGLTRVFGSVVGKLPAFDATAYALAALTVLLLSVLATLLPARSAANIDPNQVLRSE